MENGTSSHTKPDYLSMVTSRLSLLPPLGEAATALAPLDGVFAFITTGALAPVLVRTIGEVSGVWRRVAVGVVGADRTGGCRIFFVGVLIPPAVVTVGGPGI